MSDSQAQLAKLLCMEITDEPRGPVLEPGDLEQLQAFIFAGTQIPDSVNGVKVEGGALSSIRRQCVEFEKNTMRSIMVEGW